MYRGRYTSHGLVALPLMLAVLLVALCVPFSCGVARAQAMPRDCETQPGPAPMSMPTHASAPVQHAPSHQHGDPSQCRHSNANVKAVNADQQVRPADVVAVPVVVASVPVAAAPLSSLVDERPSEPPGLVLTVSQLRI